MSSTPNIGDTFGASSEKAYAQIWGTAAAQTALQQLGAIKNLEDIVVPMTDVGKEAKYKYSNDPKRPTLPPVGQLRTGHTKEAPSNTQVAEYHEEHVQALKEPFKTEYLDEMTKDNQRREAVFAALDHVFLTVSKIIAKIDFGLTTLDRHRIRDSSLSAASLLGQQYLQQVGVIETGTLKYMRGL